MTLAEQFPDVSMLLRERHKLNLKYNAALLFKDIHYPVISRGKKIYDKELRILNYELISFIVLLLGAVFFVILNGQSLWKWIFS